jgi:hypothetical protein
MPPFLAGCRLMDRLLPEFFQNKSLRASTSQHEDFRDLEAGRISWKLEGRLLCCDLAQVLSR